jgi:hypothetical protein
MFVFFTPFSLMSAAADTSAQADNILSHTDEEMAQFRSLCRRKSVSNFFSPLARCSFLPSAAYVPQAVEYVLPNTTQDVKVFIFQSPSHLSV